MAKVVHKNAPFPRPLVKLAILKKNVEILIHSPKPGLLREVKSECSILCLTKSNINVCRSKSK